VTERTLIAGIGNIFCSDDGFGVEVAHRLMTETLPPGVEVKDYGIRGLHLAYDLAGGFRTAILVDAVARGGPPGTVYVIEPDRTPAGRPQPGGPQSSGPAAPAGPAAGGPLLDAHGMQPDVVLQMLNTLGGPAGGTIMIVGCEPASTDYGIGLTGPVTAAIGEAISVVRRLVDEHAAGPVHPAGERHR
jgi:hydrogenase maturation protease